MQIQIVQYIIFIDFPAFVLQKLDSTRTKHHTVFNPKTDGVYYTSFKLREN